MNISVGREVLLEEKFCKHESGLTPSERFPHNYVTEQSALLREDDWKYATLITEARNAYRNLLGKCEEKHKFK
jgi:hypothetical protein